MNNDYLWDRTGEPDSEIQRLEEILGDLRYQPHPLAIPTQPHTARHRMFLPTLAIAAATRGDTSSPSLSAVPSRSVATSRTAIDE